MWFLLFAVALTTTLMCGFYVRRRVAESLVVLGTSNTIVRRFRAVFVVFLLLYPGWVFGYLAVSSFLERESFSLAAEGLLLWLVAYPFWLTILVSIQSAPFFVLFDLAGLFLWCGQSAIDVFSRWRARCLVIVVLAFAVYTPVRISLERSELHLRRYELGAEDGTNNTGVSFRILFVGDLQQDYHTDEARAEEVVRLANAQKADVIFSGGDWINTGPEFIDVAAKTAGEFVSPLGTLSVLGDHEHFAYRDRERSVGEIRAALEKHGVQLIANEVRWLLHGGKRIGVVFLNYNYMHRTGPSEVEGLLREVRDADYSIVVAHQFDAFLADLVEDKVDLVLTAHTHGGQVNPFLGVGHVSIARVETKYIDGQYQLGARTSVIVTAGIGYSIAPFRYASPATLELIELRL